MFERRQNLITNIVFNSNGGDVTDVFVDAPCHAGPAGNLAIMQETQREQCGSGRKFADAWA